MTLARVLAVSLVLAGVMPAVVDAQLPSKQQPKKAAPVAVASRSATPAAGPDNR